MPKERPEAGLDHQFPDLLRGRLDVVLGVFQQVIQQFAASDFVGRGRSHLAPGLFAQELVPQPNRVLPLG